MSEPVAPDARRRFDVEGRRVLVAGAAHGLGLAVASAFAGASARVAGLDVDAAALDAAHEQGLAAVVTADVTETDAVREAVLRAVEQLGGLDIVVNAAARYPTFPLIDADAGDRLREVVDANVAGAARVVAAAHPALAQSTCARVINFASITLWLGIPPGLGAYVSSKGAIVGYTRVLARELGPEGICVNAIAPGAFPTRAEEIIEDRVAYDAQILASQCLKRRGTVEDIACAALFLGSDAASFITGQTLVVDGGWIFD